MDCQHRDVGGFRQLFKSCHLLLHRAVPLPDGQAFNVVVEHHVGVGLPVLLTGCHVVTHLTRSQRPVAYLKQWEVFLNHPFLLADWKFSRFINVDVERCCPQLLKNERCQLIRREEDEPLVGVVENHRQRKLCLTRVGITTEDVEHPLGEGAKNVIKSLESSLDTPLVYLGVEGLCSQWAKLSPFEGHQYGSSS